MMQKLLVRAYYSYDRVYTSVDASNICSYRAFTIAGLIMTSARLQSRSL